MSDSTNTNQPPILWWRRFIKGRFTILEEDRATYPNACLVPVTHVRTVTATLVKQFFIWGCMLVATKTVKQSINFLHKHTSCNIFSTKVSWNKQNYIVVNFMVMVKSERNIVILSSRFNSYMSPYFLLENNEGRAVFNTLRSNAV